MGKIKDKNSVPILIISTGLMIAVFMIFLPKILLAGTINLPKTGETTCYDTSGTLVDCTGTGQDGDIQEGVEWPDPRFTDHGDGTITDKLTGLMWTQDAKITCIAIPIPSWQDALDYVAGMNSGANTNFGYTDWRLPNILEMFSLSHQGEHYTGTWLESQGFTNVGNFASTYWTSTTLANYTDRAWLYNLYSNFTWSGNKDGDTFCFWPVRAGQQGTADPTFPANIRKTGQTTCYNSIGTVINCAGTGQDGEIQAGVSWPEPRFTDNGDGTAKDNLTGIDWMKDPSTISDMTWQESLDYIAVLNDAGGDGNNRMSNVNELMSLMDFSQTGSMIPQSAVSAGLISLKETASQLSPVLASFWTGNTVSITNLNYEKYAAQVASYPGYYGNQTELDKGSTGPLWPLGPMVLNISDDSNVNRKGEGKSNDPVSTHSGELSFHAPADLDLGGTLTLSFKRYYASYLARSFVMGELGDNWRHNFEWRIHWVGNSITLVTPLGKVLKYKSEEIGTWTLQTQPTDIPYQMIQNGKEIIVGDPRNNRIYHFSPEGRLAKIQDGKGNTLTLTYNDTGNDAGRLAQVSDGLGRTLTFTYALYGSLRKLTLVGAVFEGTQRASVSFSYDALGDTLLSFTDARGNTTLYNHKDTSGSADRALMTHKILPEGSTHYVQTFYGTDNQYSSGRVATQTDANGNTHTFTYAAGNTTMTDPADETRQHTHNDNGFLTVNEYEDGSSAAIGYDTSGNRNSITDTLGDATAFSFHAASGKMASEMNGNAGTTSYTHTPRAHSTGVVFHDRTGILYPDGTTETFVFDSSGNILSRTDRGGNTWTFTYNGKGQVLTSTNPSGGVKTNTYNADGTRASRQDENGNTTTYTYDNRKRLSVTTNPDGTTITRTYDSNDNLVSVTDERGGVITHTYNRNNNLTTTTDSLGNTTTFTYDGMDRLVSMTDPLGNSVTNSYDELGRLKTETDQTGNIKTYSYDTRGNLISTTDAAGKVWTKTYDAESIIASSTDPLLRTTSFISDKMGWITHTTTPAGNVTVVTYDSMGNIAAVENPLGNVTTYTYDARGLVTGISLADGTTASYTRDERGLTTAETDPNGNTWLSAYDSRGRQTLATDPLSNVTSYLYDNRGRTTQINFPSGSVDLTHDAAGNLTRKLYTDATDLTYTYDTLSRLTTANGLTRSYDANGMITGSNGLTIARSPGRQIASITLAAGKMVTYSYNSRNLVSTISDWLGQTTTFTYDDAGQLTAMTRPNGVTTSYTYDDNGNISGITEGALSSIALIRDAKGQIISTTRDMPVAPDLAESTTTLTYDAASQVGTYSYDALGRLVADGSHSFTWDLATRLTSYTESGSTVTMAYDALGNLISRSAGDVTRTFVINYAIRLPWINIERQGPSDVRYYITTPAGVLLYSIDAGDNSCHYYHFDEMGNTLFLTNDSGAITDTYLYGPYGENLGTTDSTDNPFTWQGKYGAMRENGSGLYYMRSRWYDSQSARFISRDIARSKDPREINPYQYAVQNPLDYIDPLGNESHTITFVENDPDFGFWETAGLIVPSFLAFASSGKLNVSAKSAGSISTYLDNNVGEGDTVESIAIIGHGVPGQAPLGLALDQVDYFEKQIAKKVAEQGIEPGSEAEKELAKKYYQEQADRNDPSGVIVNALLEVKFDPNATVYIEACYVLGEDELNEKELKKLQKMADRVGVNFSAYYGAYRGGGYISGTQVIVNSQRRSVQKLNNAQ